MYLHALLGMSVLKIDMSSRNVYVYFYISYYKNMYSKNVYRNTTPKKNCRHLPTKTILSEKMYEQISQKNTFLIIDDDT